MFENVSQYKSFKTAVKGAGSIIQIIHYKNQIFKKKKFAVHVLNHFYLNKHSLK